MIKISEYVLEKDFATLGVYPREIKGIGGIFLSPLIHGSFKHLIGNSVPVFLLSAGLFYYYNKVAYKVFFMIYLAAGLWVWVAARQSYHIGASGVVYGLAAFHFLSGIVRKHGGLMAFSMLVVFLYGSMVWGIFPLVESVSWESHLFGGIAGLLCAIVYRKEGPQRKEHVWEDESDEEVFITDQIEINENVNNEADKRDENEQHEDQEKDHVDPLRIIYHYTEPKPKNDPGK